MKINKELGYAISWLNSQGKAVDDIASELGVTSKQVSNYLEKHTQQQNPTELKIKSEPVKSADLMIRHTRDKKTNTVSIMTREASQVNDSLRSKMNVGYNKNADSIFRPKP